MMAHNSESTGGDENRSVFDLLKEMPAAVEKCAGGGPKVHHPLMRLSNY
jgi:hypothetical protein